MKTINNIDQYLDLFKQKLFVDQSEVYEFLNFYKENVDKVIKDQQNFQDPILNDEIKFSPEFQKSLKQLISANQNQWSQYLNHEQFSQKFNLHQQVFLTLMLSFADHLNEIDNIDDQRVELSMDLEHINSNLLDEDDLGYYQNKYFIDDFGDQDDLYNQLEDLDYEYYDEIKNLLEQNREVLKDIFKQSQVQKTKPHSLGK